MSETERVFRLLYVSENRIAGDVAQVAAEIERVLESSRRNNAALGITGALIFNCGFFAQVLEGPPLAVEQIFEAIQRDVRHTKIQVISADFADARQFPHWSMAYVGRSPSWEKALGWMKDATNYTEAERDDRLFRIVTDMAHDAELSADRSFGGGS
ncbi:BLUF domain-containing protein [Rhodopseudomonas sp. B29]|uniref:BLUF domain-containing protein n=1 Tax=Rhodopseudomonas sp. B29 TaxID=95607 RepID=UPI0004CE9350|nr:BLUF domain-containing protein [Rhodopseudomonas sp. B29]